MKQRVNTSWIVHASLLINKYLLTKQWTAVYFETSKKLILRSICLAAYFIFHHHLIGPGWYGNPALIHSAYVLHVAVHECRCVFRGSGGSSMQHMPGKFCHHLSEEQRRVGQQCWERPMEEYKGKGSYKKRWKEGWLWWETQGGRCKKALPIGFNPSDRTLGSCSVNTSHPCLVIYHSVPDAFFHNSELCRHWSTLQRGNIQVQEIPACKWICLSLACRAETMIKGEVTSLQGSRRKFPAVISERRSTYLT